MEAVYLDHSPAQKTGQRLVFRGLSRDVQVKVLVGMLCQRLDVDLGTVKLILQKPPRPLWVLPDVAEARRDQAALAQLGCVATLEEVIVDPALPCALPQSLADAMAGRLDARGDAHLAVAAITARTPSAIQALLKVELEAIAKAAGQDYQAQLMDCRNLLLIGVADAREGVMSLRYRLLKALPRLIGEPDGWRLGLAIHPADGESPSALLSAARRRFDEDEPDADTGPADDEPDAAELEPERRALLFARGASLATLADAPPEELAGCLASFDKAEQQAFTARLSLGDPRSQAVIRQLDQATDPQAAARGLARFVGLGRQPQFVAAIGQRRAMRQRIQAQLERIDALPALPHIVTQVVQHSGDQDGSAEDLTQLIDQDPGLTAKILKLANSAFFGFKREITAVKHAVVILGADEVTRLAMTLATARLFQVQGEACGFSTKSLWTHAIAVALIARELAQREDRVDVSTAYTAGLLHDLGRVFLLQHFTSEYSAVCQQANKNGLPLHEVEADLMGLNHADVGRRLAEGWNLPAALSSAIGGHHLPEGEHSAIAATVGLADHLHHLLLDPADRQHGLCIAHQRALGRHFGDLAPESLALLVEEIRPTLDKAAQLASS